MASAPIVLVPGFWLGAWAWDEVADALRADDQEVSALTLPGLESADADRSTVTFSDHVDSICHAVEAAGRPVVLAVHSAAGFPGYAASDRVPELIAAMVYVDTGPGMGAMDADFDGEELPLPPLDKLRRTRISTASATSSWRLSDVERCRSPAACSARPWSSRTTHGSTFPAPRSARVTPQSSTRTQ